MLYIPLKYVIATSLYISFSDEALSGKTLNVIQCTYLLEQPPLAITGEPQVAGSTEIGGVMGNSRNFTFLISARKWYEAMLLSLLVCDRCHMHWCVSIPYKEWYMFLVPI